MRVVHITPYFPPCKGGIARFVSGLVESTGKAGDVHVITKEGVPGKGVSVLSSGKGVFIIKALQILRKMEPDVIHCHSHWHMLAPAVVYRRFHKDVRVIFTFHTEPLAPFKGPKGNIFERLLKRCNAVTYVSISLKNKISDQMNVQTEERVVRPGVRAGAASPEEVEDFVRSHGLEGKGPKLAFIGLLEWAGKVEGVKILVRAVEEIRKKYQKLELLIVGDGSRRGEVEEVIAECDVSDNVTITGMVENVFIPLTLCDVYVHITLQEGLTQALLEAMSAGKPAVASSVGGIPEVIVDGENGILVSPDKDSVVTAVEGLLDDPSTLARLGKQAESYVRSHFTWEKTAKDFLELYSALDQ
jgi:glycosyltransferase involved in cell wall biosynthesis